MQQTTRRKPASIVRTTGNRPRYQRAALDRTCANPLTGTPRAAGFYVGERWAPGAPVKLLRNLERLEAKLGGPDNVSDAELAENFESAPRWHAPTALYLDIVGAFDEPDGLEVDKPERRAEAAAWWNQVLGDQVGEIRRGEFLRGFFCGALSCWKAKLRAKRTGPGPQPAKRRAG